MLKISSITSIIPYGEALCLKSSCISLHFHVCWGTIIEWYIKSVNIKNFFQSILTDGKHAVIAFILEYLQPMLLY